MDFLNFKNNGTIKDIDVQKRVVTGYFSAFGNVDSDNDIIEKGAFSKSINERFDKIMYLQQHDWSKPLGKPTMLKEDDFGLYFEAEIINTSYGLDQLKLYEAGVVKEHSIGFQTIKADFIQDNEYIRVIKEVKLYEGSAVTLGANSSTPFMGFKSELKDINEQTQRIIKLLKHGDLTDDTFVQLEFALKMLQQQSYELGKEFTQKNKEPQERTQLIIEPNEINKLFTNFKF